MLFAVVIMVKSPRNSLFMGVPGVCFRRVKYSTNPVEICRQSFSARALEDAFVPTYDRMKRYQGQWHVEQGIASPDVWRAGDFD